MTATPSRRRITESAEIPSSPTSALPTTCIHTLRVCTAIANITLAPTTAAQPFEVIRTRRGRGLATHRNRHCGQHLGNHRAPGPERIGSTATRTSLQHEAMSEHKRREHFHVVRNNELTVEHQ